MKLLNLLKARGLDKKPAFGWWVDHTLKKRDMIITSITSKLKKSTHKFGVEVPTDVEHTREFDRRNKNTL